MSASPERGRGWVRWRRDHTRRLCGAASRKRGRRAGTSRYRGLQCNGGL